MDSELDPFQPLLLLGCIAVLVGIAAIVAWLSWWCGCVQDVEGEVYVPGDAAAARVAEVIGARGP